MFNRLLLLIFFLTASTFGATQYEAIMDVNLVVTSNWDSTSGNTKITSLSDASDATYIWTTVNEADRFGLTNATTPTTFRWDDELDSLKIFWRAKKELAGTAEVYARLHSPDVVLIGTVRSLSTTLTDYAETFNSVTGFSFSNVGDWELSFTSQNMASDTAKVVVCSVGVYFTRNPIFYFTNTAGCSTGANFGKTMERFNPSILDTVKVIVPGNTTENDYFSTIAHVPYNNNWETGGATVYLNLIKNVNPCSVEVRMIMTDSLCVWVDSSSFSTKQTLSGLGPQIQQTLDPNANPSPTQWDSTGTGTKLQMITDATDGNYIESPVDVSDTDMYAIQDFSLSTYEFEDRIDSLVVYMRAQKSGIATSEFKPAIVLGSDTTAASDVVLTTSWANYSRKFTTPPGSRGTWDIWEIDSTKVRFTTDGSHGTARITNCSTVVYITKWNTSISIPSKDWPAANIKNRMQCHFKWTNPTGEAEDTIWFQVGSNSFSRLEHEVANKYESDFLSQLPQLSCGGTLDSLLVDDTTAAEQAWTNFGGANKVASVTDENNATYVFATTAGTASQRFTFADNNIHDAQSVDTIEYRITSREFDDGNSNNRISIYARTTGTTNFCSSPLFSQTSTWTNFGFKLTASPSAASTCAATLDTLRLDSLQIQLNRASLGSGDTLAVSRCVLLICYTPTGGAEQPSRRRIIGQKNSEFQEFARIINVNVDPTIGFFDSRKWLWTNEADKGLREPDWVLKWE